MTDVERYITGEAVQAMQEVWDGLNPSEQFFMADFLRAALPVIYPMIRADVLGEAVDAIDALIRPGTSTTGTAWLTEACVAVAAMAKDEEVVIE